DFESIQPDNSAPYAAQKTGGKHGYIDDHGRMIVPFLYDTAARCSDGLCRATLGRDTVYFDTTGKKMLTVAMNADVFSEGLAIVQAPGFKFGFIDRTGKLAIPAIYQAAQDFHGGFAAVQRAGKWGYIDRTGKTVVPFKWTEAGDFSDGFASVTLETFGTKGQTLSTDTAILNAHGKTLWRAAGRFNYYLDSGFPVVSDPEKERFGVVDPLSGHLVVPMKHKYVSVSGQGLIVTGDDASRVALLDRKGAVILPIAERTVEFNVAGVLVSTGGAKPSARLYDVTGRKAITTTTYDELGGWWTSVPHLGTFRRGATGGLMDARGRETCTVPGASAGAFVTNATPVLVHRYYKRWSTGAFTHHFASDGLVKFKVNGKWGLYDFHCRVVSAPSWEDIGMMREWMVPVKSAGKWGLLKITARTAAP
ncbi:WG repeat-containing protein, partial [Myxococcota bacterium]|nr:WG repeat-containing protein [Myxococcota bacterium]